MNWQKIREHSPQQWILTEAIKARSEGGKRIPEQISLINAFNLHYSHVLVSGR